MSGINVIRPQNPQYSTSIKTQEKEFFDKIKEKSILQPYEDVVP